MAENVSTMDSKQYIVVELGNEQYGIDIQYIDNIVRMQRITRVPKAQNFFKGVINLRGEVIPVMSLRLKFDFAEEEYTNKTRILIIKPFVFLDLRCFLQFYHQVCNLRLNHQRTIIL